MKPLNYLEQSRQSYIYDCQNSPEFKGSIIKLIKFNTPYLKHQMSPTCFSQIMNSSNSRDFKNIKGLSVIYQDSDHRMIKTSESHV